MLKIKQLLCSAFITRDIMGSGTVGGGYSRRQISLLRHWV